MPTNPRITRVQNLRRSNAAGPHGTGRRPVPDLAQEIADAADEHVNPGPRSPGTPVEA